MVDGGWRWHVCHIHRELCCEKFGSRYEYYSVVKSFYEPRCRGLNLDIFTELGRLEFDIP
jgi:hypothetical protein